MTTYGSRAKHRTTSISRPWLRLPPAGHQNDDHAALLLEVHRAAGSVVDPHVRDPFVHGPDISRITACQALDPRRGRARAHADPASFASHLPVRRRAGQRRLPKRSCIRGRMRFPYRPSRRPAIRPASTSSTARRGARFPRRPRCCRAGAPGSRPKSTTRRSATPSGSGAESHVTDSNICCRPSSWSRLCVSLGPRAWKTILQERAERRCWP